MSSRHPSRASLVLVAALLLGMGGAVFSAPTPLLAQASSGVIGTWRFVGGPTEVRGIQQAIDASLADFNPVMREIVAAQLQDTNRAYPEFSIAVDADNIVTRINGRTVSTPSSGAPRQITTPEGRSAEVTQRITGHRLVQTMVNPQGTRTHTITLGSDGNLTVEVRIESSHLPRPIRYTLTYARAA